jgi:AcrR family transcriptional regulator
MEVLPARPAVAVTPSQRDRRERILRAATELLTERDYERVQIRDVADRAGVALGTLYRYFPSKEQLFVHVLVEWGAAFPAARGVAGADDAERLERALRSAVRAFERRPNFFRLITALEVIGEDAVTEPYARYSEGFRSALRSTLHDVHPDDVETITTLAAALLSTLLRNWSHGLMSAAEVHRRLAHGVRLLFNGPRPAPEPATLRQNSA